MGRRNVLCLLNLLLCLGIVCQAIAEDMITITDGPSLTGEITKIGNASIELRTDYAGDLLISLAKIDAVAIESADFQILDSEQSIIIPRRIEREGGSWRITHGIEGKTTLVSELSIADQSSESIVQSNSADQVHASEGERDQPWKVSVGFNMEGREGNRDAFSLSVDVKARYTRAYDRLDLYGRYDYGTSNDRRSKDEIIAGLRYTNFFQDKLGWFLREELETDDSEGVRLRSTTAGGLSYRIIKRRDMELEGRGGLSYRYEDFQRNGSEHYPGMDFGLEISYLVTEWARFTGTYSYVPSLSNVDEYILEHDSGFNIPLDEENLWKLRFGVRQQFNSITQKSDSALDSSYYAQLILAWD